MSLTAHRDDILAPVLSEYFSSLTVERAALLKQFTIQDLVFKVVGVGSVGTRCMVLLLIEPHGKPLFLQLKEASKSVVSMFFKGAPDDPADPSHAGRRVVHGQRLMQAATDLFLGWSTGPLGRALYVRQLRDMKISAELETFGVDAFRDYAALCGWVLARAHAKASGRALEIAGYLGSGQRMADALVRYGRAYADQVEKDYDAFRAACRDGRLEARSDADMAADFAP
jgi:uncharacterized protein (DUF2252 family)